MCRCFNGLCSRQTCECKQQNKKCIDCWCIACENRDETVTEKSIQIKIIEDVKPIESQLPSRFGFGQPSSNVFSSVNQPSVNSYQPRKYEYNCGCGVSKCGQNNCGCRKKGEDCKKNCRCPPDCRNNKNRSRATIIPQVVQQVNPRPIIPSGIPLQSNLFYPELSPTRPQIVQQPIKKQTNLGQKPSTQSTADSKMEPLISKFNNLGIEKKGQNSCCPCLTCDKKCPCFRLGECCTTCKKECLNIQLSQVSVAIPNYIKF